MEYITAKQASEKWGITANRITILCKGGRIPGAIQIGTQWMIPSGTQKPADGRTKLLKNESEDTFFRFPSFINSSESSSFLPLSREEEKIKNAEFYFYNCEFAKAKELFESLCRNAESPYIKQMALFYMCTLSAAYDSAIDYPLYYNQLNLMLAYDFPHCQEMKLLLPWMKYMFGMCKSVSDSLTIESCNECHPSVFPLYFFLSFLKYSSDNNEIDERSKSHLPLFELMSRKMEMDGNNMEAQELHSLLFISYLIIDDEQSMLYHLNQLVSIAYNHNLLFRAADLEPYYPEIFKKVLYKYPDSFVKRLRQCGKEIFTNFTHFTEKYQIATYYKELSDYEYQIIMFVACGYSNKKISELLHFSERTVANKLSDIYASFNVSSRKELIEYMKKVL